MSYSKMFNYHLLLWVPVQLHTHAYMCLCIVQMSSMSQYSYHILCIWSFIIVLFSALLNGTCISTISCFIIHFSKRSTVSFLSSPTLGRKEISSFFIFSQTLLVWLCLYYDLVLSLLNWIACGKAESQSCSTAPHWSNRIVTGPYIRLYEIRQLFNKTIGDGLINGLIIWLE